MGRYLELADMALAEIKTAPDRTAIPNDINDINDKRSRWVPHPGKSANEEQAEARLTAPLTAGQEAAIRAWLAHIKETEPEEIRSVLNECRADPGVLTYFLGRAAEVPKPADFDDDDRRCCDQCAKLASSGRCQAAARGEIEAGARFMPVPDLKRRCTAFCAVEGRQ